MTAAPETQAGAAAPPPRRPSGLSHLVLHLHPRAVPAEALRFRHTLGLGGAALVLFLALAASGLLLLAVYEPAPGQAWVAVRELADEIPFGALVRNLHHWAANGLVLVTLLHLLRVVYRGAHLPPRRGNWLVGLALLLLVVASAFTGYLLPWDQLAYWAVTIATGMLDYVPVVGGSLLRALRGGAEVGPRTLSRFFVLHVALLPALALLAMALHFWLVRKAGGVLLPRPLDAAAPPRVMVPASPELTRREATAALVVLAAVLLLAAVVDAPLLAQANPGASPNPAKAPWYFMGLQELLVHLHPLAGAVVLPALGIALLAGLPWLSGPEAPTGRWFGSPRGARLALAAALAGALLTKAAILGSELVRRRPPWFPGLPAVLRGGLFPLLDLGAILLLGALLARRRGASRAETVQALFTLLLASLVVLTLTGVFFRGQGMALTLPWRPVAAEGP